MTKSALWAAVAFIGVAAWAACGGDDDDGGANEDPVALCKQSCGTTISLCFADAGDTATIKSTCENACTNNSQGGTSTTTCTNANDIVAAFKACLKKTTCTDYQNCLQTVPRCQGGGSGGSAGTGGSGGTSGTGTGGSAGSGTSGTGGTSGGGTCADLLACCNKAASEPIKSACLTAYNQASPTGDAACSIIYSSLKATVCP